MKKFTRQDMLWLLLFTAATAFLVWKLPYGFGSNDEPFYYTIPQRLLLGDRLFRDEWHLSQLTAFFTYPLTALFYRLSGSFEGLVLFVRSVYALFHTLVAAFVYLKLRKHGIAAVAASLLFVIFTPFDIMTLCYNTMGIDFLTLACVSFACGDDSAKSLVFSGAAFACAVVNCPYLAAVWFLFALCCLVYRLRSRRGTSDAPSFLSLRAFFLFTLGIVMVFLLFCVFIFRFADLRALKDSLPYMLSDPEHPRQSLLRMGAQYVLSYLMLRPSILIPLGIYLLSLAVMAADKKRQEHRAVYLAAAFLVFLLCEGSFIPLLSDTSFNYIVYPLAFPGLTAYLLLNDRPRRMFWLLFVPGLLYSVCVGSTSNLGFKVISMSYCVTNIASLIFIGELLREPPERSRTKRASALLAGLCIVSLLGLECYVKATHCLWTCPVSEMKQTVERGPAKGLKESDAFLEIYNSLCEEADIFNKYEAGTLLSCNGYSWDYLLMEDYPNACYSAWIGEPTASALDRLADYYRVNPAKLPQYIWLRKTVRIDDVPASEYVALICESGNYTLTESELSYFLIRNNVP